MTDRLLDFPRYTGVHPAPPPVRREDPDWEAYTTKTVAEGRAASIRHDAVASWLESPAGATPAEKATHLHQDAREPEWNFGVGPATANPRPSFELQELTYTNNAAPGRLPLKIQDEMRQTTAPKSMPALKYRSIFEEQYQRDCRLRGHRARGQDRVSDDHAVAWRYRVPEPSPDSESRCLAALQANAWR